MNRTLVAVIAAAALTTGVGSAAMATGRFPSPGLSPHTGPLCTKWQREGQSWLCVLPPHTEPQSSPQSEPESSPQSEPESSPQSEPESSPAAGSISAHR